MTRSNQTKSSPRANKRRAEIVEDLLRVEKDHPSFGHADYAKYGRFSPETVRHYFGGLNPAKAAAGLAPNNPGRKPGPMEKRYGKPKTYKFTKNDTPIIKYSSCRRPCLQCHEEFDSWDKRQNQICRGCANHRTED